MNPLIAYWYFHLPNFVLAAVMYTLVGRILLSFFAPPGWRNCIWRAFVAITAPALSVSRALAPAVVPEIVVMVFAIFWIALLRGVLFLGLANAGLLPGAAA